MANKYKELLEAGGYVTDSTTGLMYPLENKDTIVEEVKTLMDKRSQQGIKEYGVTLEDNPDGFWRWVNELQTELLDAALYLQKLKKQK
tara:strand:- start:191 stop:454 length:264 start_codon:yes stop_codon:yes gene_type:complete